MEITLTLNDSRKVSRGINARVVRLANDNGRHRRFVRILGNVNNERTVALIGKMLFFKNFHKLGNVLVSIALAVPVVEINVKL